MDKSTQIESLVSRQGSVDSAMPLSHLCLILVAVVLVRPVVQQDPRPQVVLEHADSVIGIDASTSGIRRYEGNVRFRQGNVTVSCDRAIEYIGQNTVDLSGRVRVRQGDMELRAPIVHYNGNLARATAQGGVIVRDGTRSITSLSAVYSPEQKMAIFTNDVLAQDDSVTVGADTLRYFRTTKTMEAWGGVVLSSVDSTLWLTGDTVLNIPMDKKFMVVGRAKMWSWGVQTQEESEARRQQQSSKGDTLYIESDTIVVLNNTHTQRLARGNVKLRNGTVASRSQYLAQDDSTGVIVLLGEPILWSDETQITGDTIYVFAPQQRLRQVSAIGSGFMLSPARPEGSRGDTTVDVAGGVASTMGAYDDSSRWNQVSGAIIHINFANDTIQEVLAIGETRSLYYRFEDEEPQGLAQFASDTLRVTFESGVPEDIRWLGTVRGEQHPENIVAGRTHEYQLPGFMVNGDKPLAGFPPETHRRPWRQSQSGNTSSMP
jgi:lipopolysaccharide export system protein LptA